MGVVVREQTLPAERQEPGARRDPRVQLFEGVLVARAVDGVSVADAPHLGVDGFGVYWSVPLAPGAPGLSNIIHRGDTKDPGADQFLDVAGTGYEV